MSVMFRCLDCREEATIHQVNLDNFCLDCEEQRKLDNA